jgi:hypothetical protein
MMKKIKLRQTVEQVSSKVDIVTDKSVSQKSIYVLLDKRDR